MTEEEFKKTMKRVVIFIVIAIIILVAIGIVVFGTSKKETSIFGNQAEIDNYKRKVQEINAHEITEADLEKLDEGEDAEERTEEVPEGEINPEESSSEETTEESTEQ